MGYRYCHHRLGHRTQIGSHSRYILEQREEVSRNGDLVYGSGDAATLHQVAIGPEKVTRDRVRPEWRPWTSMMIKPDEALHQLIKGRSAGPKIEVGGCDANR